CRSRATIATNRASNAAPAPSATSTPRSRNPDAGMVLSPHVIAARPPATVAAPPQSSFRASGSRLSHMKETASPAAAIASGTLSREAGPPRNVIDQPPAQHRAGCCHQSARAGPNTDGLTALMRVEGGSKDGEARRRQQSGAKALDSTADDEQRDIRGEPTADR